MDLFLKYGINASFVPPVTGYMELLHDSGTLSSAVTSYTISDLNISKKDNLLLVSDVVNVSSLSNDIQLFCNNNQTATNYIRQKLSTDSTTFNVSRVDGAYYLEAQANALIIGMANIKLSENGYFVVKSNQNRTYNTSGIQLMNNHITSEVTFSSITRLDIVSGRSLGIGAGSRFKLYRVRD